MGSLNTDSLNRIVTDLRTKGYSIQDDLLASELIDRLTVEAMSYPDTEFSPAGIGRQQDFQIAKDVRRDSISWITGENPTPKAFLQAIGQLKTELNRQLILGLFDYEAHFAQYPIGGFYDKHLDAFKGRSNRILSTVLYLNPDWSEDDGGELIIFDEHDPEKIVERVLPIKGRLVIFLSESFYHQVNTANKKRYSIAGWFRVNNSILGYIDPSQ